MRPYLALGLLCCAPCFLLAAEASKPTTTMLFDFEQPADGAAWSNLVLEEGSGSGEPSAKWELSTERATSGKRSLKITYASGTWPTISTKRVPSDWAAFETFLADVTVSRPCLVGFTVMQEGSKRDGGYAAAVGRWTKTALLAPGRNTISAPVRPRGYGAIRPTHGMTQLGAVVSLEFFVYSPHDGETIWVDDIRLSSEQLSQPKSAETEFRLLGTDLIVRDVKDLASKLADRWTSPSNHTAAEVEAAFRQQYQAIKQDHPQAVLAVFRDGTTGYDRAQPQKVYSGWDDAYFSSHGPDGQLVLRSTNEGNRAQQEVFMRHRSPLMRIDCSSIPSGSQIVAAQLLLVRASEPSEKQGPHRPNMWVAEACNRPWIETEVNAYRYAKDRYWKGIGGMYYGDDPDFLPIYLAYGPAQASASSWDFTEAVRFWTSGTHQNHGFMLHGDSADKLMAWSSEAEEIENRPALMVIYVPK